jgi:tetratricopeptide (TPR) repeat protein
MLLSILAEARDYAGLAKEADRLIAEDKERWWAVLARGVAKRYSSDKDGAVQDFEAALNLTQAQRNEGAAQEVINTIAREIGVDDALTRILPRADKEPRWRFAAAQLYLRRGDYDRAAEAVERLVAEGDKLQPNERLQVLRFAGTMYQTYQPQPQADKAYQAYLKVLDIEPNDFATLNNIACLVAEQLNPPRPKEALQYSQKAFDVMSSSGRRDALIFDTHGWVLTLNDRPQEGIELLRQAVALQSFAEGHYHLGEAYLRTCRGRGRSEATRARRGDAAPSGREETAGRFHAENPGGNRVGQGQGAHPLEKCQRQPVTDVTMKADAAEGKAVWDFPRTGLKVRS